LSINAMTIRAQQLLLLTAVAALIGLCSADTPANCSYADALGTWQIWESERYGGNSSISCNGQAHYKYSLNVTLQYPDQAVDSFGNVGFWTLVYNQGFEVRITGRKYFGYFQWRQSGPSVVSLCNLLGTNSTAHDLLGRNWACFKAAKLGHADPIAVSNLSPLSFRSEQAGVLYRPNPGYLSRVNSAAAGLWRAVDYPEYHLSSLADLTRRAGGRLSRIPAGQRPRPAEPTQSQKLLASLLPDSWDWRQVNGQSYVSPVRNQASCGSCYSFSSTGMLEARLKILTRNSVNYTLSEQDVVECSPYSQGCDGGFPYLIAGKYAEDYGMALEECNPYKGQDGVCRTKQPCRRLFATNYQYVGGYYGACSEEAMRIALVNHGPLSVSFEVYSDFLHYRGGIYRHTGLRDKFNPFEVTNHAVLLVGYGVDSNSGVKYWIVKNSWGTSWGEQGFFRIVRGADECAIESLAVESFPMMP
ncbi:hypothetical protein BOX15_Mlig013103g1, partial [Macrostomum lignano]